jgi:two-component system, sensor histidine kinase and response regulator
MQTAIPPTVMVINDDALQLRLTVAWIEKDGLRVLACQSAEEALSLLRRGAAVDVIVTDLHMPHIDGWRLCHLLRSPEYAAFNHVPILVLSATFAGADATRMSTDLEANAFLSVPYDPAILRAHVRDLLAGRMPQAPLRALIVEDSHTLATLLRRTLASHGYTVDVAGTGREGLQKLQEQSPELAILDYHLPDMTGDQLLPACARSMRPVVAIMITTDPTPELALHFMRLGAYGYLRKPFDPVYLVDLCARALRERALLRVEELLEERTRALRTSEAQFRLLFESIPDAVFVHDADGTILAMNEVGAHWLERPAVDVVGQHISTLLTPYNPPLTTNGSTTTLRTMSMTHTGHRMIVEVTERPSEFNGKPAILSVVRDITERERAIVALQAAKDYAENIINSSLDIIVSVDTERRIIAFNKAAQQAFGYEPDEVLGQPVHLLYADPAVGTGIHHHALTDGHYTGEITNTRKDGTLFESYLSASVLRDRQGQVLGVMGISRDITERKQAEAALQASKEAAEAANRSKNEFLANVSHEIRTPMNGILGMAELALGTELSVEQREYLELVKVSAEALLGVINDLLDFSKIEAGKLVLDPREFSLRTSLNEAMKTLAVAAYRKGLELVYEVQPEVPDRLIGDVGRLRQIIVNLVGNAIKFTTEGEVVLRITLHPGASCQFLVPTRDTLNACELHVSVADTGVGIPATQQHAIFEPFVQADGSMTRRYGGTGLGLSIAAQLVALMGGRIWVESTVGTGSTFHCTVHLGVQPGQSAVLPVSEAMHGLQVLVVDDNTTQRHLLQSLLGYWSMCPILTESGPAALETLRHAAQTGQPFAAVILDAHLPCEGSFAVALWLRQQPALATTPLIVLTAATQAGDRQHWQELHGAVCVTKPIAPAELWEALHQALVCAKHVTPVSPQSTTPEAKDCQSLRVLLAEDNAVNQHLAVRLLEKRGHTVTVVQDGTEALAAIRRQTFDVVLMDIQMPHMDGLETTRAIRAREQDTATHVPIVAMTAHAMQGDRERCLAAGMDGYVTKPLRPMELFEVIASLTAPATRTPETPPAPEEEQAILDRKTLWERVAGDADLLREIVELFLADCPERLMELHEALTHQDCTALMRAAHRLKGALGNISANNALAAVRRVETLARAGDVHAATEALARLEDELARLTPLLTVCAGAGQPAGGQGYAENITFG